VSAGPATTAAPGVEALTYTDLGDLDLELPSSSDTLRASATSLAWTNDFEEITWLGPVGSGYGPAIIGRDVLGGPLANVPQSFAVCGDAVVAAVDTPNGPVIVAVDPVASSEPTVRWTVPDDGQVVCGTGDTVLLQSDELVWGLDLATGDERWSVALEPDDPPLAAGPLMIVGTYDGVVALDAATGGEAWRLAGSESSDAVVAVGEFGLLADLSTGYTVIGLDGAVAFTIDEAALDAAAQTVGRSLGLSDALVVGGADALAVVWPDTPVRADAQGVDSSAPWPGELFGAAAGGAVWVLGSSDGNTDSADSDAEGAQRVVVSDLAGREVGGVDVPELDDDPVAARGLVLFEHGGGFGVVVA
jgi:hypothetical protein